MIVCNSVLKYFVTISRFSAKRYLDLGPYPPLPRRLSGEWHPWHSSSPPPAKKSGCRNADQWACRNNHAAVIRTSLIIVIWLRFYMPFTKDHETWLWQSGRKIIQGFAGTIRTSIQTPWELAVVIATREPVCCHNPELIVCHQNKNLHITGRIFYSIMFIVWNWTCLGHF